MTNGKEIYAAILNVNEKITSVKVAMMEVKTRQEERHSENIKKFDTLFEKINEIPNVNDVKKDVNRIYWLIFLVIIPVLIGIIWKVGG